MAVGAERDAVLMAGCELVDGDLAVEVSDRSLHFFHKVREELGTKRRAGLRFDDDANAREPLAEEVFDVGLQVDRAVRLEHLPTVANCFGRCPEEAFVERDLLTVKMKPEFVRPAGLRRHQVAVARDRAAAA